MPGNNENWFSLGANIYTCGTSIFSEANVSGATGSSDPKIIALTLLARTLSNFDAAVELIRLGYIVEARAIARCCYENLFWIGGLSAKGKEFIDAIESDEMASKKKRGKWLLEWQQDHQKFSAFDGPKLQNYMEQLEKAFPKPKLLNPSTLAASSPVKDAYIFYSQLSSDAAHPSASSLSRYVSRDSVSGELMIHQDSKSRPKEMAETMEYACNALIGVCVGANELVGGTAVGGELAPLFEEYKTLSNALNKLADDHA
jgi:hypothetical protein